MSGFALKARKHVGIVGCLIALGLGNALAADGVLEINQACVANGCFQGDTAGFPVELTNPGSYILTSNLALTNANTSGIFVRADNVNIDLNGFAIIGPTSCSGDPSEDARSCTNAPTNPTNPSVAIKSIDLENPLDANHRVTISNGTLRGTGAVGIYVGNQARIFDITVSSASLGGIIVGDFSVVRNATVEQSSTGIQTGDVSVVEGCIAAENESNGIKVGDGSTVRGSTARDNGGYGLDAYDGTTVTQSSFISNSSDGMIGRAANPVSHSSFLNNGGAGITCSNACMLVGNTVRANTGFGFSGSSDTGLINNTFSQNNSNGDQVSGGIELGENVCGADLNCP